MAKILENVTLFLIGDPTTGEPSSAFMTYAVDEDGFYKKNCVYTFSAPVDWDQSGTTLWDAGVSAIKSQEGIT